MAHVVSIKPLGPLERAMDWILYFPMKFMMECNGALYDTPQQTHRYNRHSVKRNQVLPFADCMVYPEPDPDAWPLVSFLIHIPYIGWQRYVVLEPLELPPGAVWHVVWMWRTGATVSRIPLTGLVRMLRGPGLVGFCGATPDGCFIPLRVVGYGTLGSRSPFREVPLL